MDVWRDYVQRLDRYDASGKNRNGVGDDDDGYRECRGRSSREDRGKGMDVERRKEGGDQGTKIVRPNEKQ